MFYFIVNRRERERGRERERKKWEIGGGDRKRVMGRIRKISPLHAS